VIETAALLLYGVAGLLATGLLGLAFGGSVAGRRLVYGLSLAICGAMAAAALAHLLFVPAAHSLAWVPLGLPWQGAFFRLDQLSAIFGFVIGAGGAGASLFALGYGRHEPEPARVLPFYPLFLAGMNLVVLADDAFAFLLSWEFMSLTSWALVMAHHQQSDNTRAGYVYLIMASFGTFALLLAFGLLAPAGGDYTFDAMRAATYAPATAVFVLVLALLGAGSKAGLVPLHAWLPLAHPAAPSHVSALMSGVMTKVAVYGFIRIVFELCGEPGWWSGFLVLLAGGTTAVLGVLYALMQHDLKRLLAYHTVENIGIIFIGLGLALAFDANGLPGAAALALTAGLFHAVNHSIFKSLLFFGAGAVLGATGERNMERQGGLIRRMPKTAFAFLVGCIAICALPPLNGFVSEWLTFQAILQSPELPQWPLKIMVPAVGGILALSAALAAACFIKAYGVVFLGRPRSAAAREAGETDRLSLAAMFVLAAACFAAGILPGFVIDALAPATLALVDARMPLQAGVEWLSIVPVAEARSSYNGWLVFVFIGVSASLAVLVMHRFASHARRRAPAWDCGFPDPDPATQYTAASFAQPIRRVYGAWIFAARESVEMPPPGSVSPARHTASLRDLPWEWFYAPLAGAVDYAAGRLNVLQFLTIRRYLSLVFFALVALLLVLALWP
jgi:formate hydrogenlyase subunit 3/multisubunit Na+/H+ antiporter MnhD subunit